METYLFQGIVYPQRAPITIAFKQGLQHLGSGRLVSADVSILLNQITVWIESEDKWDVFDLRNLVRNLVQNNLGIFGYLTGLAYDLEITRVICRSRSIDQVFGIDIPCISERNSKIDVNERLASILPKIDGMEGVLFNRCFNDLNMAMKSAEDTGFYCYRAIESLRQHCRLKFDFPEEDRSGQWQKLREIANTDEATIRKIKSAADTVRHGGHLHVTSENRADLFNLTWGIVDAYIDNV